MKKHAVKKKKTSKPTKKSTTKKKPAKVAKSPKKQPVKKSLSKPKVPKKTKKAKIDNGMTHFQQCLVLAAFINQARIQEPSFQILPLPEIHSSLLSSLREYLSQYMFTADDILKAIDAMPKSEEFIEVFPIKKNALPKHLFSISEEDPKTITKQLLDLAGHEAKKTIFLMGKNPHDIRETTLEKYALKTGQIEENALQHEAITLKHPDALHRQILDNMNVRQNQQYFNPQNISMKHRRGRG